MDLKNYTVDVIIPYYNAASTLTRALCSVAMQTVADKINVTIVDDCSTEPGLESVIDRFNGLLKIEVIKTEENGGPAVARQAGLDATDGDFVCFMDADDSYVSAFAIFQMARAIMLNNMDLVSGQFIEETAGETFYTHGQDLIWVFGKMYRRSFLDRFLIRFNETRCNEDTGFNCLCNALTQRIEYIPQSVYMWHHSPSTITRNNNGIYTWAHGHRGYIENMIWATKEMERRGLNKEIIRKQIVTVLCRLYFMHESVIAHAPEETAASWEWVKRFYTECFKPIEDYVPVSYVQQEYITEHKRSIAITFVPRGTFRGFLGDLRRETENGGQDSISGGI
jgi:glycosyltransferase involved in cell wall biosynthesis